MVTVTKNHVSGIPFPPILEIEVISLLPIWFYSHPGIERLIHYQETHPVAKVEELRCKRIMRRPYRIDSGFFQQMQPPFPNTQRNRRTHRASVMMQAYTLNFNVSSI